MRAKDTSIDLIAREAVAAAGGPTSHDDWESIAQDFAAAAGVDPERLYDAMLKYLHFKGVKDALPVPVNDAAPSIGKNIAGYYFKLKGKTYGGYPTRAEALREYKEETAKKAKDEGTVTWKTLPKPVHVSKPLQSVALKPGEEREVYRPRTDKELSSSFGKDGSGAPKAHWPENQREVNEQHKALSAKGYSPIGGAPRSAAQGRMKVHEYEHKNPRLTGWISEHMSGGASSESGTKAHDTLPLPVPVKDVIKCDNCQKPAAGYCPDVHANLCKKCANTYEGLQLVPLRRRDDNPSVHDALPLPVPVKDFQPLGGLKCQKCGKSVSEKTRQLGGPPLCALHRAIASGSGKDTDTLAFFKARAKDDDQWAAQVDVMAKNVKDKVRELKADGVVGMGRRNFRQVVSTRGISVAPGAFDRLLDEAIKKAGVGRFIYAQAQDAAPRYKPTDCIYNPPS